ncbi:hypothetical protein TAMC210_21150 [Thermanaeromonas sp. C210]|nr:hypothetical protein TAMC210_21150 [Thermanaeromonas sp. C210]
MQLVRYIIACEVLRYELESLGVNLKEVTFLKQGLHRTPDLLRVTVQENIERMEKEGFNSTIILGYGLCGNGITGLQTRRCRLVIPKADDCIGLLLGSRAAHERDKEKGNAYYLSRGWIEFGSDPYKEYQRCVPLYGGETARWILKEMLKGYTRVAFIDTGQSQGVEDRQYTRAFAAFCNLHYDELQGDLRWLERLINLQLDGEDFLEVFPGRAVDPEEFRTGNYW